jgi:hypothetical protein
MAKLTMEEREEFPVSEYACPIDKKLPINDAAHVRNAMARFDQVITEECHPAEARKRILAAAKKYGVDVKDFGQVKEFKSTSKKDRPRSLGGFPALFWSQQSPDWI